MPRGHMPFTEFYFKVLVLREAGKILGIVVGVIFAIVLYLVSLVFPGSASDIMATVFVVFVVFVVAGCIGIVYGVISALFRKPKPRPEWAPHNAIANPDPPWFDSNGNRLYVRVVDCWERVKPEL
jgi:NADH:ubiquinone oxidoreductase subunit K